MKSNPQITGLTTEVDQAMFLCDRMPLLSFQLLEAILPVLLRHLNPSADLILVCNSLDAGGIERVVSTLANAWNRQGRNICVVTLHDRRRFYSLDAGVQHVIVDRARVTWLVELFKKLKLRLEGARLGKSWLLTLLGGPLYHLFARNLYRLSFHLFLAYEAWALRRVLERVNSPVVISFGTSVNIMTLKASRGLGRRVIISERGNPERLLQMKIWNQMSRRLYGDADLVTANTQNALQKMGGFVDRKKLAFVPNPLVPRNGNGSGNGYSKKAPFVLSVGRLVWDKAHDILLDAFAHLNNELSDWRLSIVGDGGLRGDLIMQAERLGIAKRVDWHGLVPDPHVFYSSASIFVMPSRIEGMPNALLEAMSWGLPVIVTDGAPGPLELVEDGRTGLVVPANDAAALAKAMLKLTRDHQMRVRLGAAARERVAEYHLPSALATWESVIGLSSPWGSGREKIWSNAHTSTDITPDRAE